MTDKNMALMPQGGWHCLHLFYRIEYGQWQSLSREEQNAAKTNLASLVQEARVIESTQLLSMSIVTPKADVGFMLFVSLAVVEVDDLEAVMLVEGPGRCVDLEGE